jgi:hypothetical protein
MGFFFLLAFIAVLIVYLSVAGYSIHWLRKRNKPKYVIWLAVAFWVLLPTWDTIVSLSYHQYVCATEPDIGLKVYQAVPLDPKFFDSKTGRLNIYTRYMELDLKVVGENISTKIFPNEKIGRWPFEVVKFHYRVFDNRNNKTLAEFTDYYAAGEAWFGPLLAPVITGGTTYQCVAEEYGRSHTSTTLESIFTKDISKGETE